MRITTKTLLGIVAVLATLAACNKSSTSTTQDITCSSSPTYTNDTKTIIASNCATSGCHSTGSGNGDFTTYAGLKPYLTNGSFYQQVITSKSMPRGFSLSTANYNTLYCWSQNNYAQ